MHFFLPGTFEESEPRQEPFSIISSIEYLDLKLDNEFHLSFDEQNTGENDSSQ
jgi:hypothetical protein